MGLPSSFEIHIICVLLGVLIMMRVGRAPGMSRISLAAELGGLSLSWSARSCASVSWNRLVPMGSLLSMQILRIGSDHWSLSWIITSQKADKTVGSSITGSWSWGDTSAYHFCWDIPTVCSRWRQHHPQGANHDYGGGMTMGNECSMNGWYMVDYG